MNNQGHQGCNQIPDTKKKLWRRSSLWMGAGLILMLVVAFCDTMQRTVVLPPYIPGAELDVSESIVKSLTETPALAQRIEE